MFLKFVRVKCKSEIGAIHKMRSIITQMKKGKYNTRFLRKFRHFVSKLLFSSDHFSVLDGCAERDLGITFRLINGEGTI